MKSEPYYISDAQALQERLSNLCQTWLRISAGVDFDAVMQEVLDGARSLTGAKYAVITLLGNEGQIQTFLTSGLTVDEVRRYWETPGALLIYEHLNQLGESLRLEDFDSYVRAAGLPQLHSPMVVKPTQPVLMVPLIHRDEHFGNIYLIEKEDAKEFTEEDEKDLKMLVSLSVMVIANARRYRDEQRARAELEMLINTSLVGVLVFDGRSGQLMSCNQEARRIVGDSTRPSQPLEELLIGVTVRRTTGREFPLDRFSLVQAVSAADTVRAEEVVIKTTDGRSLSTLINATPIRPDDGRSESFVVTLQDLSSQDELERMRSKFLGIVSHELRTPLTAIKGCTVSLLNGSQSYAPAEMRQFHRIIDTQVDRMQELLTDLLDVGHIEVGSLSIDPEPCDLTMLVDRARNTFLNAGFSKQVSIDLPPDLPQVMVDPGRIVQVLGNLLSNAARHSQPSSNIRVSTEQEELYIAVSVTDDGNGLAPEDMQYLFRKFSRVDTVEYGSKNGSSTGLGLAICKGIVEAHRGQIWVESEGKGKGSRFTFTIPIAENAEISIESRIETIASQSQQVKNERGRILVVDDDPQTLRYVRDILSGAGYSPIVTADPEEVSDTIEVEQPDLVLLDMMLPGTDGINLMGEILNVIQVPVIFLSAYGQEDVVARAFDMGAADYMVKPFSPTELIARIRAARRRVADGPTSEPNGVYTLGDLTIDYDHREIYVAGQAVKLTATEYHLLQEISAGDGKPVTHDRLLRRVWGYASSGDPQMIRAHMRRLRRKLGDDAGSPSYITTEPRVGYRMARLETTET